MTLAQLLMTTAAKNTPLIALFCQTASIKLTSYYEARMMATRLSKCYDTDSTDAAGSAVQEDWTRFKSVRNR